MTTASEPLFSRIRARFRRQERGRRVPVPTVLQMEAVECGAASLAMILSYFGRYLPLEEVRTACGVSRDGSKASNLLKAARGYGLTAQGYKKEPGDLRGMKMPVVVHWNFNHFAVLEGFRGERVYLNDPGRGPIVVTDEEFDRSFTGVVLQFKPGPEFERGGRPPGIWGALVPRLAGSLTGLGYVILIGFALLIPGMVVPTLSRIYVDNVLIRGLHSWLTPLLVLVGAVAVVQALLVWLQQHHLLRLEAKLALQTSGQFFWHVLRLPFAFFIQRYAGDIANRVTINDRVARLLSGDLATTVLDVFLIAFYAVLMIQYDVVLTAVGVAAAVTNIAVLRFISRQRITLSQRMLQDRGKFMGVAMGGLQTIETLKATGSEGDFFARWSGHMAKLMNSGSEFGRVTTLLACIPPLLLSVTTALVLGLGGLRVMDGTLTMGMLLAFQALMLAFITPVNRMVNVGSTLQEVRADMTRLDDVLRAEPDPYAVLPDEDEGDEAPRLRKLSGRVDLQGVTFGYSRMDPPLISSFSLSLKPGSRVALVGKSGSGKSTVGKIVTGLYQPWEGEFLLDGEPRSRIPRNVLNRSLALVEQDVFMFEGSVHDNLTLWDVTIPEEDVLQAARDACIHDEIVARGGYNTRMEEGGKNFSGGQRQRFEIARALAGNPSILMLDEGTSALDPATEKIIDDNLRRRGCTCIIVAHRLSTIRDCDEIIVMDGGVVVQRGTHDEMSRVPGPYQDLIASE